MVASKSRHAPMDEKKRSHRSKINAAAREARSPIHKQPYFPMGKIHWRIQKAINRQVDPKVVVYLTSVLEYVAAEILEVAGNECLRLKPHTAVRITPENVTNAIKTDEELSALIKTTE